MSDGNIRDKVEKLIRELLSVTQTRSIYGQEHNLTKEAIDKLYLRLNEILAERQEFTLGIIGNEIAFEKEPFYETSKILGNFILHLKEIKVEKISFLKGVTKKELADFVNILAINLKDLKESGGLEEISESTGIQNIIFGKLGFIKEKKKEEELDFNTIAKGNFQQALDFLEKTLEDIKNKRLIDIKTARLIISNIIGTLLKNKYSLLILTSIKSHDEYTFVHAINVAIFTLVQAEVLGLDRSFLNEIGVAALLHDTGKLALSGEILRKKEKLDEEEIEKIHTHPIDGAKILIQTPDITPLAAITAFEHHLRYDMKGYPQKIYGKKINLISMMITIADYYDALRSKRAYHEEMAPEKTYQEMLKMSGDSFHPDLLDNFFSVIGVYPAGTLVELNDGTTGLVIKGGALDIRRPQVEVLYDSFGQKIDPYIINLLEKDSKTDDYKWSIIKSISPSGKFVIPDKYL